MVCWLMAPEVLPDEPGEQPAPSQPALAPLQLSPFEPETVQVDTFSTSQNTFVVTPCRTICGLTSRCPVWLPDEVKAGTGYRQMEEPAEQKPGEAQVVTLETEHEALVYWMVWPEHEYVGMQEHEAY